MTMAMTDATRDVSALRAARAVPPRRGVSSRTGASAMEYRLIGLTNQSSQDHVTMVPLPTASMAGVALIGAIALVRLRNNAARLTIPA